MSETWYEVFMDRISQVTVTKETDQCVWVLPEGRKTPSRAMKKGNHWQYFRTYDEARQCVLDRARNAIKSAKEEVERCVIRETLLCVKYPVGGVSPK